MSGTQNRSHVAEQAVAQRGGQAGHKRDGDPQAQDPAGAVPSRFRSAAAEKPSGTFEMATAARNGTLTRRRPAASSRAPPTPGCRRAARPARWPARCCSRRVPPARRAEPRSMQPVAEEERQRPGREARRRPPARCSLSKASSVRSKARALNSAPAPNAMASADRSGARSARTGRSARRSPASTPRQAPQAGLDHGYRPRRTGSAASASRAAGTDPPRSGPLGNGSGQSSPSSGGVSGQQVAPADFGALARQLAAHHRESVLAGGPGEAAGS